MPSTCSALWSSAVYDCERPDEEVAPAAATMRNTIQSRLYIRRSLHDSHVGEFSLSDVLLICTLPTWLPVVAETMTGGVPMTPEPTGVVAAAFSSLFTVDDVGEVEAAADRDD